MKTADPRLDQVESQLIRPLNQAEVKSVLSDLRDIAKAEPAVAALLESASPLRDFLVNVLTLSPYLRETANYDPSLVAAAIAEPLLPQIERLVTDARNAWAPGEERRNAHRSRSDEPLAHRQAQGGLPDRPCRSRPHFRRPHHHAVAEHACGSGDYRRDRSPAAVGP